MNKIIYAALGAVLLSSCGVYSSYERPSGLPTERLYASSGDSLGLGQMSWREVFTDGELQQLIDTALVYNHNLRIARLRVDQAEASLSAARKAFFPSLALAPQGTIASFDGAKASQTYQLPLVASWQVDIFGSLRNAKKRAAVALEASHSYRQAVQSQLIGSVASAYYSLSLLDAQIEVSRQTVALWGENVRTMKAMMQAGQVNDAAVSSSEAAYAQVSASLLALEQQRRETEHALNLLLGRTSTPIRPARLSEWRSLPQIATGLPLLLLSHRPDVRQAELALSSAFYGTAAARSAFYPSITLTGSAGWTNSAGGLILNPAKTLLSLVGSLTQPLFQRGQLTANLKIAKSQQAQAQEAFVQTLLSAGVEVNNRLSQVETYRAQAVHLQTRTAALLRAERATRLLMETNASTYLEVLTAQQNLLSAQLAELTNRYNEIASTIALYQALGGGAQ